MPSDSIDDILADLVARRLGGEEVTLDAVLAAHADRAEEIRARYADLERLSAIWRQLAADGAAGVLGAAPAPPARIGDFEVLRQIGRGGMGAVYLARQEALGREVALKIIPQTAGLSPVTRQRFLRETRALSALSHPNIVPVYTAGESGGCLFIAMEYVEGASLAGIIAGVRGRPADSKASDAWQATLHGPAAPAGGEDGEVPDSRRTRPVELDGKYVRTCLALIVEVSQALSAAHEKGIVHRDVKPANILIDRTGRARLLDFGLAAVCTEPHVTVSGEFFGTPHYVSPEQAQGRHELLGPASDVYSLGATLYECLTLSPPFDAPSVAEVLNRVISAVPARPRQLNPALPRDLETIVTKAMAHEVKDRYASAGELADDVERFLDHRPIRARPIGPLRRLGKRVRRNPVRAALAALVVLAAVAAGVALVAFRGEKSARQQQEYARQMYLEGMAYLRGSSMDGQRVAVDSKRAMAALEASARAGNSDAMMELAYAYYSGGPVEADMEKTLAWARAGDDRGDLQATEWCGFLLLKLGRAPEAIEYLGRAAERGHGPAKVRLAETYLAGREGVPRDRERALSLLREAAGAGVGEAMGVLARLHGDPRDPLNDPAAARAWADKGAAKGDVLSMVYLARMCRAGDGGPRDDARARKLMERAAREGHVDAMYEAARMYTEGLGGKRDVAMARYWLELAHARGHVQAGTSLAALYCFGRGAPRDYDKAKALLDHSIGRGDAWAMYILGDMYRLGRGIDRDAAKAEDLLRRAAEGGYHQAFTSLGRMWLDRKHGRWDPLKAKGCFEQAAGGGDAQAMILLGIMHMRGETPVAKDADTARQWFIRAAEAGDGRTKDQVAGWFVAPGPLEDLALTRKYREQAVEAKFAPAIVPLARMLLEGRGGPADYPRARQLLEQAVALGDPRAMFLMGEIYYKGLGVEKDLDKARQWDRRTLDADAEMRPYVERRQKAILSAQPASAPSNEPD